MEKANGKGCEVRALLEDPERHYSILGDFPFVKEEKSPGNEPKDNQANNSSASPGVGDSTIFEAKEEHDSTADNSKRAEPINRFQAVEDGSFRGIDIEEENKNNKSKSITRH